MSRTALTAKRKKTDHHPRLVRIHLDHLTFLDRSIDAIED